MKSERCLCTGSAADIRTPPEFQSARHAFVRNFNFPPASSPFFLASLAPFCFPPSRSRLTDLWRPPSLDPDRAVRPRVYTSGLPLSTACDSREPPPVARFWTSRREGLNPDSLVLATHLAHPACSRATDLLRPRPPSTSTGLCDPGYTPRVCRFQPCVIAGSILLLPVSCLLGQKFLSGTWSFLYRVLLHHASSEAI